MSKRTYQPNNRRRHRCTARLHSTAPGAILSQRRRGPRAWRSEPRGSTRRSRVRAPAPHGLPTVVTSGGIPHGSPQRWRPVGRPRVRHDRRIRSCRLSCRVVNAVIRHVSSAIYATCAVNASRHRPAAGRRPRSPAAAHASYPNSVPADRCLQRSLGDRRERRALPLIGLLKLPFLISPSTAGRRYHPPARPTPSSGDGVRLGARRRMALRRLLRCHPWAPGYDPCHPAPHHSHPSLNPWNSSAPRPRHPGTALLRRLGGAAGLALAVQLFKPTAVQPGCCRSGLTLVVRAA